MEEIYKCSICGSEELSFKAWVDKNFKFEGLVEDNQAWCQECGDMLPYSILKSEQIK